MYSEGAINNTHSNNRRVNFKLGLYGQRKLIIGLILALALVAFEIFNFDTTRFALESLLGGANFAGLTWAVVLAIAFCAIDFAGLARLFTPEQGREEPKAVWYLMGAWLLGATMNAIMTWWAVNLTLLNHELGNEVLSRQQLIRYVPIFVATLVWLTRILFIGAFSIAGEQLFDLKGVQANQRVNQSSKPYKSVPKSKIAGRSQPRSRIRHQPQMPGNTGTVPAGMHAQGRSRDL
ncbi:MAG: hypothetical protein R3293_05655 [Candidatus Promineifilaceae bacterium]|nr:hypothetical protein [Candidatus Promineifilaceae bacterium]